MNVAKLAELIRPRGRPRLGREVHGSWEILRKADLVQSEADSKARSDKPAKNYH